MAFLLNCSRRYSDTGASLALPFLSNWLSCRRPSCLLPQTKRGGCLCVHWNAKNQKQNVSPTWALFWSKRCTVRSHSLIWKFLKRARASIKNFHGQGVAIKNRYHVHKGRARSRPRPIAIIIIIALVQCACSVQCEQRQQVGKGHRTQWAWNNVHCSASAVRRWNVKINV